MNNLYSIEPLKLAAQDYNPERIIVQAWSYCILLQTTAILKINGVTLNIDPAQKDSVPVDEYKRLISIQAE